MIVYFSEDRFDKYGWGRSFRELVRKVGQLFVWWYPLTIIIISVSGGLSYQLPDWAQLPYWLSVFALFSFYLVWMVEGTTGRKIFGKRSILDKPTEAFLELSHEGAQIIADTLVQGWKGLLSLLKHPTSAKISTKRATLAFISIIEVAVISFAYFVRHLNEFDLLYVFGAPLCIHGTNAPLATHRVAYWIAAYKALYYWLAAGVGVQTL